MQHFSAIVTMAKTNRATFLVRLFMVCLVLPVYLMVIPGLYAVYCMATDKALRARMAQAPLGWWSVGFVVAMALSTSLYGDWLSYVVCAGVGLSILCFWVVRAAIQPTDYTFLWKVINWGSIAAALLAIAQSLIYPTAEGYRATSISFNPNYYAMLCAMFLLCILYQWMEGLEKKGLLIAAGLACVVGMIIGQSRAALAAGVVCALVLLVWMKNRKLLWWMAGAVAVCGGLLLLFPSVFRMDTILSSLGIRSNLWHIGWEGFIQRPLFGQGAWAFTRLAAGAVPEVHTHQLFLELLLSAGVVGVGCLLVYFFGQGRSLWQLGKQPEYRGLSALAFCTMALILLCGLLDVTIFGQQNAALLMCLFAAAGLREREQRPGRLR